MSKNTNTSFLKSFIKNTYGIGQVKGMFLTKNCGINVRINSQKIKTKQLNEINKKTQLITTGKKLKDKIKNTVSFLIKTKTYKGIRHKLKYPARGQRTHTNAKTKKNLNIKKKSKSLKFWSKNKLRVSKIKLRSRKIFKNKPYIINPYFQKINVESISSTFSKKISIKVTPNNVFCTLKNITKEKTIKIGSSGKYNVKTSKKTLRYSTKIIVGSFLEEIKNELQTKKLIVDLIGPIRIRKAILKQLSKYIRKSSTILNVQDKKCFNGCRPPKKRRKKQKGLRIFK